MNNQDWERFGEEIRRTVQNAVDSQDYRRLNQTISDTINRAVGGAAWGMRNFGETIDRAARNMGNMGNYGNQTGQNYNTGQSYTYGQNNERDYVPGYRKSAPLLYKSTTGAKVGSIFMMAVGYSIFLACVIVLIVALALIMEGELNGIGFHILTRIFAILAVLFGVMAAAGTSGLARTGRFKKYLRAINGRELCNISELAGALGKPDKYVVKDIKKLIRKGWFKQGHLDKQKTCLILTNRAYNEYLEIEARREEQQKEHSFREQEKKEEKREEKKNPNISSEVQKIIEQGDEFVRKIRECNDAIPGEEISAKISRIEMLVDRIFDRVEQNPETVPDIRKLMEYYLPTTVKLLEAYAQMDMQPVGGENIQTAKREIEATLDTLNMAFEKLLDDLFQDTAWDISSDISVLHTMLAQEGLTEDGLKK